MVFVFLVSREGEAVVRNCLPYNEAQECCLKYLKNTYVLSSNHKKKQTQWKFCEAVGISHILKQNSNSLTTFL